MNRSYSSLTCGFLAPRPPNISLSLFSLVSFSQTAPCLLPYLFFSSPFSLSLYPSISVQSLKRGKGEGHARIQSRQLGEEAGPKRTNRSLIRCVRELIYIAPPPCRRSRRAHSRTPRPEVDLVLKPWTSLTGLI